MQVCIKKLAIFGEYQVDDCWMVTCNHHLDDRLSLSHVSRRRRRPGVFAVNDIHWWIDGHALEGNFYDANHRRYVEDKLSKNILTPYLETPKDIVTKRREALSGSQICRRANFHADRWHLRRDICPGTHAKIHTIQQMIYTTKRMLALRLSYKKTTFASPAEVTGCNKLNYLLGVKNSWVFSSHRLFLRFATCCSIASVGLWLTSIWSLLSRQLYGERDIITYWLLKPQHVHCHS